MKVEITRVTSWKDVLNAARFTQRKEPLDKEPSDDFKRKIIRAEHSPLRCLMFNIDLYDIPRFVSDHLVRHIHAQPFVSTGRHDIIQELPSRHEQRMDDLYNMRLFLNAQEIINISKVRLCARAETETRKIWLKVIKKLFKAEPILAEACQPSCVYRGICPEIRSCGFYRTEAYNKAYDTYINNLTVFADGH
jgi:thymidylate synthase ThyX